MEKAPDANDLPRKMTHLKLKKEDNKVSKTSKEAIKKRGLSRKETNERL